MVTPVHVASMMGSVGRKDSVTRLRPKQYEGSSAKTYLRDSSAVHVDCSCDRNCEAAMRMMAKMLTKSTVPCAAEGDLKMKQIMYVEAVEARPKM